ncbi:MAG TPA: ABC transporter substrate-binding protein [Stellaceae bacterium]|nr:ABC transporter substrate-binding protein [Stellaceae bacterium]
MKQRILALALGALLAAAALPATAGTIKIGLIATYSGPGASFGDQTEKGIRLYMKEHEKELPAGTTVELLPRDDTGPNPETAKRLAQELITRDHVQFLTGGIWSPNALAIAPLTAEAKVPFIVTNAAAAVLPRLSPYVARVSFTLWQECLPFGKWAAEKGGLKKVYVAVSDFAPGHEAAEAFTMGFKQAGGTIVDSVNIPLKDPDFVPYLQRVKDAKPDAVFVFVPSGKQATALFKAYSDLGMAALGIKMIGSQDIVPDEELPNMGQEPLGVITVGTYSNAAKRPADVAFVKAWKQAYGDKVHPGFMAVGGWDAMAAIYAAIKATNGAVAPDKVMAALKGWKSESPRGEIMIDPDTRDIVQHIYIRKVEKQGEELANVEFETLPMTKDPWKEMNPPK